MPIYVYAVAGIVAVAALALLGVLLATIENWSRDFSTNVAATDDDAPDERLRPIRSRLNPAELATTVEAAARELPRWTLAERKETDGAVELHFIRTTPLWRFKDDIRVLVAPTAEGGSLLTAESRSRVGKGDLGQNPRNLRELLEAVRRAAP